MRRRDPRGLTASYEFCRQVHRSHGRTYYLATRLLPAWKRPHVHALYGFARYTDDIVDRLDGAPRRCEPAPPDAERVGCWRSGRAAGLVKASTGYAFQRIQRDSAAIAASLVQNGHPFATPAVRSRYRLLDAVMLDVLERDPAQLELAFAQLFRANPVERVLSFLDEATRIGDDLLLMASLPPGPYLRALARRAMSRQRLP